jgi:lipopolysaccharide exporter
MLRFSDRAIGLVSLTILARLLSPEDFGLLGLAWSLIVLLEIFGDFSVEQALIRDQQAQRRHYDTAWTLKIMKGAALAGLIAVLAGPTATFFSEPRVEAIAYWLALAVLIGAFENIGIVNFWKNLEFSREFAYFITGRCASTLLTLVLAMFWRSYWALVAGTLAQNAIRVALSYTLQRYRPRFSLAGFQEIFHFSKWMLVQNVIHGVNSRAASFIIGRISGADALAHYNIAHEISTLATSELRAPIRRAIFPAFAKVASDLDNLKKAFLDAFGVLVAIGLPIPIGIALTAPLLVRIFLGPKWIAAIPLIEVLALYGIVQSLSTNSYLIYLAINKPRITAFLSGLYLIVLLPLLIWGVTWDGALGAAWALVATSVFILVIDLSIVLRMLQLSFQTVVKTVWRVVVAALVMALAVRLSQSFFAHDGTRMLLPQLLAAAAAGAVTYSGVALVLWTLAGRPPGPESWLVAFVRSAWNGFWRSSRQQKTPVRVRDHRRSPALIVFGANAWDEYWQTRQHIMARLGQRGWPVLYSTGAFHTSDRHNPAWRGSQWFSQHEDIDGVLVNRPSHWQLRSSRMKLWDRAMTRRHARSLIQALPPSSVADAIVYVFHPGFWPYLEHFGACRLVYHADDAFSLMSHWTPELHKMQAELVAKADLVVTSSPGVARLLPGCGPSKARQLPNGADAAAYMKAAQAPCPPDLAAIPHPRIGYTGRVNLKVDLNLVAQIAQRRPQWHWIFVGPVLIGDDEDFPAVQDAEASLRACRKLRNVHFLGAKPYHLLPAYVNHMDVNTMCYRCTPGGWWTAIYPLKLHEYLATGKPIVGADLEVLRAFSSVVAITAGIDGWINAIECALNKGGVGNMTERQAVAMQNTWDHRVDRLEGWLREVMESGGEPAL